MFCKIGKLFVMEDSMKTIYTATFTFVKGEWDADFYQLDEEIAKAAKALPGYLGEEAWENAAAGIISNVYYWNSLDALHQLINHPVHQKAKAAQARWLNGFHVVIAQVVASYGDGALSHPLAGIQVAGNMDLWERKS